MDQEPKKKFSPSMASVVNRNQASKLARSQPERAYALALTIPDGWYRCQAMSTIAELAPDELSEKAFRKAREAAAAAFDEYQHAAVLAYAITAALARGRRDLAEAMFADALALIPAVEPMASRAYALHLHWCMFAKGAGRLAREAVIASVQAHCHPDRSWRARRLYREIAANLAWDRPDQADALVRAMPEGKARAFMTRRRAENERRRP
jgi:hypothetical protein